MDVEGHWGGGAGEPTHVRLGACSASLSGSLITRKGNM